MLPIALDILAQANAPAAQPAGSLAGAALFYAFALFCVGAALTVAFSKNIVRMAVALMFALVGIAGLYFLLNAEFLAAVQLVIYTGGTLILMIFGVMLTSRKAVSRFQPKRGEYVLAILIAAVLLGTLTLAITRWTSANPSPVVAQTEHDPYALSNLGQALLGDYLIPFELASVLLLTVMIGAAYLARGRRETS
ncbi:MAG TPA: NADH-quinone oxidoreductase subunit J [Tepidisphaeraceae bacterium]|jgi:NADH-quinone oxidoreductase subunit J|nr:NADH-quinone oxidoreductase subunit J [Tepidisphaeraceae bacterium]